MMYKHRAFVTLGLVLILQLLVAFGAQAQTLRYVRPGASGNGSGTDWANAYTSLPTTLTRGAIYYLADGSYSSYTFTTPNSGTQTITLRKATPADHGTDTGWNASTMGSGTAQFQAPFTFYSGYWIFDGVKRNADWRGGYGIKVVNPGNNKAIDLSPTSTSGIVFRYVEVQGAGMDGNAVDRGFYAFGALNFTIQYCYLHDFGNCPFLTGYCQYWTLEYTLIARNSSDPVNHGAGWAAEQENNMIIRYNIWEDIEGTSIIDVLNRDSGVAHNNANWDIYGNVFMYSPGNPYHREGLGNGAIALLNDGVVNIQYAQNWRIFNNSFINLDTGISGQGISSRVEVGLSGKPGNSNVQIYNNFWWKSDSAGHVLGGCTGCSAQNNRYDETPHGSEANMEVNNTASTATFVNYAGKDFRLAAPTQPGISVGSPLNIDRNGNVRGADGNWDRGAFEYVGGADVTPPTISAVSVTSLLAVSAIINWTASENATGSLQLGTSTSYGTVVADVNLGTVHATALVGLLPGTLYHYRIVATDVAGNASTSGDFTFTTSLLADTTAPTVSVTTPAASAVLSGSTTLAASASDELLGSGMASVTFLVDGNTVATDTSSPYSTSWSSLSVANGTHTIAARAADGAGNQRTSSSVTVTVQNGTPDTTAPTVSLTAPAVNEVVSNTVTFTATASDNSGGSGVASVTYLVDGNSVGSDTTSPYSVTWNSQSAANGSHTVVARAQDGAGNQTSTSARSFSVQNPAPTGIVGDWLFDEASGNAAVDSSGFGNTGSLSNGPVRISASTSGRVTGIVQFDGVNDFVRVPDSFSLRVTNAVTISAWVNVTSGGQWQVIATKLVAEGANAYPYSDYSLVAVGATGGYNARMAIATSGGSFVNVDGSTVLSYGSWHHLLGVYDGTAVKIYVDGVVAGSVASTGSVKSSGQPLYIGRNGSAGDVFKGTIDDVRVYNRALSLTEIQDLYNAQTIAPPSNLRLLE